MADKFGPIYEELVKKNVAAYESGNADAAAELYDEHGVIVAKKENKSFYGTAEIKKMIEGFIALGKIDFKKIRQDIQAVGGDRFLVDLDYESTIVATGVVMKGTITQLFEKKGDGYKVIYEAFTMQ